MAQTYGHNDPPYTRKKSTKTYESHKSSYQSTEDVHVHVYLISSLVELQLMGAFFLVCSVNFPFAHGLSGSVCFAVIIFFFCVLCPLIFLNFLSNSNAHQVQNQLATQNGDI